MACMISKTIIIAAKIWTEIDQTLICGGLYMLSPMYALLDGVALLK